RLDLEDQGVTGDAGRRPAVVLQRSQQRVEWGGDGARLRGGGDKAGIAAARAADTDQVAADIREAPGRVIGIRPRGGKVPGDNRILDGNDGAGGARPVEAAAVGGEIVVHGVVQE